VQVKQQLPVRQLPGNQQLPVRQLLVKQLAVKQQLLVKPLAVKQQLPVKQQLLVKQLAVKQLRVRRSSRDSKLRVWVLAAPAPVVMPMRYPAAAKQRALVYLLMLMMQLLLLVAVAVFPRQLLTWQMIGLVGHQQLRLQHMLLVVAVLLRQTWQKMNGLVEHQQQSCCQHVLGVAKQLMLSQQR
jgi:hypothetical protein